jgi:hypothetical protein
MRWRPWRSTKQLSMLAASRRFNGAHIMDGLSLICSPGQRPGKGNLAERVRWLSLYSSTQYSPCSLALLNRQRIRPVSHFEAKRSAP